MPLSTSTSNSIHAFPGRGRRARARERVGMSEGGGLLGDYYTPHYEAPLGIEWHGERGREGSSAGAPRFVFVSRHEI